MTAPHVLAAVDFSDASARAVAVAGYISQVCDGRLTLLHAESIEAPVYFTSEQLDHLEHERRASRAAAHAAVARFGQEHTATPFSVVVVDETPGEAIVHASATADLIVMGTHGRHGPARWWLGSVAERAMHALPKPLLVVRSEVPQPVESLLARIVVLAERRASGARTLEYGRSLAARCGGTVFDERGGAIEQALERTGATLVVVPAPQAGNRHWTGRFPELVVRSCAAPVLFIPELSEGGTS
jgi:nucleotide-binding universal stress UspA family protein